MLSKKQINEKLQYHESDWKECDPFPMVKRELRTIETRSSVEHQCKLVFEIKTITDVNVSPAEKQRVIEKSARMIHSIIYNNLENDLCVLRSLMYAHDNERAIKLINSILKNIGD